MILKLWHWGIKTFIPYMIPGFVILALAKLGAFLQNNIFIYAMIGAICVVMGLVVFNKLSEKYYPHIIGAIGFALLIQTTLMGPGLIGSDIHGEYYFYNQAVANGWDATFAHPYNAAVGTTVIAPFLTNVFHIPGYWVYKIIFPLIYAFVPFILYFIFKKEFGAKVAFLSAIFFIVVPTWSMEMIALPREMLGELMLVLCLFLVLVSKWRLRVRVPLLIALGTFGAMFHYVMGPVIWFYLGLSCLFLIILKRRVFPVKWLGVVVVSLLVIGISYYGLVAGGMPLKCISGVSSSYLTTIISGQPEVERTINYGADGDVIVIVDEADESENNVVEVSESENNTIEVDESILPSFITKTSPLMKVAWGADFMHVDNWSKVFRIFQYLTQIAIVIGVVVLIKNRKKYSAEYLSLCLASIILLGACMFIPKFASLINATRMYHITLFLLAPVFILGGQLIFRNLKLLTVCLIIPYFLFTSGLIFEATQQTDISYINMPYSISLSNDRVDMVGVFTENDIAVRDWAIDNIDDWIYADTHNILLLAENKYMYPYWYLSNALKTGTFNGGNHIFLSERNNKDRAITLRPQEWEEGFCREPTSGMRVSFSYEEVGLDKYIENGEIIYQQGNAYILEVK